MLKTPVFYNTFRTFLLLQRSVYLQPEVIAKWPNLSLQINPKLFKKVSWARMLVQAWACHKIIPKSPSVSIALLFVTPFLLRTDDSSISNRPPNAPEMRFTSKLACKHNALLFGLLSVQISKSSLICLLCRRNTPRANFKKLHFWARGEKFLKLV